MKPAKSRGHAMAHRWLYITLVDVAAFIAVGLIWDANDRPGVLIAVGAVLVAVGFIALLGTLVLYGLMFAAWATRGRAV